MRLSLSLVYIACIVLVSVDGRFFTAKSPSNLPECNNVYFEKNERSRREYEMLMEYEHQRYRLQTNDDERGVDADLFVIQMKNDTDDVQNICSKYGLSFIRKVFEDENLFLFQRRNNGERYRRQTANFLRDIGQHSEILWTSRQTLKERIHRVLSDDLIDKDEGAQRLIYEIENLAHQKKSSYFNPAFNDPLFTKQWYLYNRGQTGSPPGNDVHVLPVWQSGITGKGVAILVLDDGVDGGNEEVAANYESTISDDFLFRKTGLHPVTPKNHGTRCAAIAAGVSNNSVCGVGVAYDARVGGVRILDGPLTDVQEALALVHGLDSVDIYTASWGPSDKGQEVDGPDILARMAFVKGVTMGRRGRGSVYVWAAGNGGGYGDHCSLDGYASSPFTLTIGALTEQGRSAFYSEPCPALIASAYVGGRAHSMPSPEDWKEDQHRIKVVVPEGRGKCKETFQGTSAAAPIAAGVIALVLQANPDLTWRDVQHLIIRTSRVPSPVEHGWITNGAGYHFHPKIGSGALDALALVTLARHWRPVASLRVWSSHPQRRDRLLPPKKTTSIPLQILKSSMEPNRRIDRLETVIATVRIKHVRRRSLEMALQSPSGTRSQFITRRPLDNSTWGFQYWDFVSLHFWGEDPEGVWILRISNHHKTIDGFLDYFSITLHGT